MVHIAHILNENVYYGCMPMKKETKKKTTKKEKETVSIEDPIEEETDEVMAGMDFLKKEFLAKAEAEGSINQQDIYDVIDKNRLQLEDNDVNELIEWFTSQNIKVVNGDEVQEVEEPSDADLLSEPSDDDVDDDLGEEEQIDDDFLNVQSGDVKVNDSVKMYLKDIGQYQLLTVEEEQKYAKAVVDGEEAKALLPEAQAKGDIAEIARLSDIIEAGKEGRDTLVNRNLRLVIAIAKKYLGRGMPFLDLIQEGNQGLLKAVEKFDYTKGFKFSTYATWWIRQAITRAIADQARTIRIPVHMVETINKMTRVQRALVQELGRDPTPEEISEKMEGELTPAQIRDVQRIALEPVSLDTPIGEEDDSKLGDFVRDDSELSPGDYTSKSLLKERLYQAMSECLTDREEKVIRLRYGLDDGHPRTLEEVGKDFGVTRERIRQIEAKAIRKLRHPTRAKMLGDYRDSAITTGPSSTHRHED